MDLNYKINIASIIDSNKINFNNLNLGDMVIGLATAPFRCLGSLLAVKGHELKKVDFKIDSAVIISTEYLISPEPQPPVA